MESQLPIVGITMGDPAGNGPEITVKALSDPTLYNRCRPIVIGDAKMIEQAKGFVHHPEIEVHPVSSVAEAYFRPGTIDVYHMDLVKDVCPERIYPVGRLDRNTTGVLLLTNDGDLASKLTHPKFLKKKVYHVHLDRNVTAHDLQQIRDGITLEDGEIKADAVEYADDNDKAQVGIEIHSGKNRIVRRIFESLGYRVTKLDRVQFAGLTKKNLRRGDWRFLTEKEVDMLRMGAFE